jgi:hypothetical protein
MKVLYWLFTILANRLVPTFEKMELRIEKFGKGNNPGAALQIFRNDEIKKGAAGSGSTEKKKRFL